MISEVDGKILIAFQNFFINENLSPVVKFITHLGDKGTIWILIGITLIFFRKTRKTGILVFVALLCSLLINNFFLKELIARTRPYDAVAGVRRLIEMQKDFSFPSEHTGSSFAAGTVLFLYMKNIYNIKHICYIPIVLAGIIGLSRLYVGVHYPLDVLAGCITGIFIGVSVYKISEGGKVSAEHRQ